MILSTNLSQKFSCLEAKRETPSSPLWEGVPEAGYNSVNNGINCYFDSIIIVFILE